jgi:hypothetical protein
VVGTTTETAIETAESEIVDTMTTMIESPLIEIPATPTIVIERGIIETCETETYGIRGIRGTFEMCVMSETENIETTEILETLEMLGLVESPTYLGDQTTGVQIYGMIPAPALDWNDGHRLLKCLR